MKITKVRFGFAFHTHIYYCTNRTLPTFINEQNRICRSKFVKKRVTIAPPNNIRITHNTNHCQWTQIYDDLDFIYSFKYISPFISILIGHSAQFIAWNTLPCTRHTFYFQNFIKENLNILMNENFCNVQNANTPKRIWLIISQWLFYWRILYSKIQLNKSTIGHQLNLQHIFFW